MIRTKKLIALSDALTPTINQLEKIAKRPEEREIVKRLIAIQDYINCVIFWATPRAN